MFAVAWGERAGELLDLRAFGQLRAVARTLAYAPGHGVGRIDRASLFPVRLQCPRAPARDFCRGGTRSRARDGDGAPRPPRRPPARICAHWYGSAARRTRARDLESAAEHPRTRPLGAGAVDRAR